MKTFWDKTELIGQSPMDGVTDAPYRIITDTYGSPDLLFTEFIPVEAIMRGSSRVFQPFIHHETLTPILAQIYGTNLEGYTQAAIISCELGFDGVDINMGCPDKAVARKGAGAGLIRTPELAKEIIKTTIRATRDWAEGKSMEDAGVRPEIISVINEYQTRPGMHGKRRLLPVSVKTRIGYDTIVTEEWISHLTEARPAAITVHGRTLAQMYTGEANWEEIGKAAVVAQKHGIPLLGNGDLKSVSDARSRIMKYNLNGALIGRASFGNPWIFKEYIPTTLERLTTALEHAELFERVLPHGHFLSMRKHLAWYCKSFDGAAEVRERLMKVENFEDVKDILEPLIR